MNKLTEFLDRNDACRDGLERLAATGAATPDEAWERADARDLVWAVTRPGVMSPEQRRLFLVFVLESIEDKLTDPRSKNILEKLRTKSPITEDDASAAWAAAWAAAADAAAWALSAAADVLALALAAASAAAEAADAAAEAARKAADAATWAAARAARKAAREQQARWIRDNFKLDDLHTN